MQENVNIPDSTITTNLSFRNLVLMNMQQLTNFPYIEKDFDALTDYELLSLVVKYLNDVIANQNEQNYSITRIYESFLALQTYVNNTKDTLEDAFNELDDYVRNYFDNLDVQDEINNKLDQMLEDGVLEQIIEQFLQSSALWCFDNVESMKQATNLIDGSYAKTLGYHSANDGGGAYYKIRTVTNDDAVDEMKIIAVYDDTLIAELVTNDYVTPEQIGCIGDNDIDNFNKFKTLFSSFKNIKFLNGKIYKVNLVGSSEESFPIQLISNQIVDFNNSKIEVFDSNGNYGSLLNIINKENVIIKNGILHSNRGVTTEYRHGINIQSSKNILIENMNINNFSGDSIVLNEYGTSEIPSSNITINNCICENSYRNNISLIACENVNISNSQINKALGTSPQAGIDLECNRSYQYLKNININNCVFNENTARGLFIDYHNNPSDLEINVNNCVFNNNFRDIAINENETANDTKGYIRFNNITSNNTKGCFAYFNGHTIENKLPVYFNNIVINGGNSTSATGISGATFGFNYVTNHVVDVFIKSVKILNSSFTRTMWGIKLKNIEYEGDAPNSFVIDGSNSENIRIKTDNETLMTGNPSIPSSSLVFSMNYAKNYNASADNTMTIGNLPKGLKIKITNYSPTYKVVVNGTDVNPLEIAYYDTTNGVILK